MTASYIALPDNGETHRLVFYLAMEEYVAAKLKTLLPSGEDAFFIWQVPPTVIFGRNQVMQAEVNVSYCRDKGIRLYRRKSGGGCVYSDWGNIMLSYISSSTDVSGTFDRYLSHLASSLSKIGIPACRSGRNDILADGKKVSGNAFFMKPDSSIVHGTMLFDSDFTEMQKAITPSKAKIESKGVASVRQHVTNLRPYFEAVGSPLADISAFRHYLAESFCSDGNGGIRQITLTEDDIDAISEIEAGYLDPDFLEGRNHAYTAVRKGKIPDVGEIAVELSIDEGKIQACRLSGDFLFLRDGLDSELSSLLKGLEDDRIQVENALHQADIGKYIRGLTADALLSMMY